MEDQVYVYQGGRASPPRDTREHPYQRIEVDPSVSEIAPWGLVNVIATEVNAHVGVATVGRMAFHEGGTRMKRAFFPGLRVLECGVFSFCPGLEEAEFGEALESIIAPARNGYSPFAMCDSLRRIKIPLKADLFNADDAIFKDCNDLVTVDLAGNIHNIVSCLHYDHWKDEMKNEIGRINLALPVVDVSDKTRAIHEWIQTVLRRIDDFKTLHHSLLSEEVTPLFNEAVQTSVGPVSDDIIATIMSYLSLLD